MFTQTKNILAGMLIALLVGGLGGYFIRNMTSSQNAIELPEIFALGTELIDTPTDLNGDPFDLTSVFAFSDDYFHCVIETNAAAFSMPTYSLGTVTIGKNQFFMAVDSVSVDRVERTGDRRVELSGMARSITKAGDKYEEAVVPFVIRAVDGGPGHQNDTLALVLTYDEKNSPMQFAIFGPEPHFGKGIISGDITLLK